MSAFEPPTYEVCRGDWPIDSVVVTCFLSHKTTPRGVYDEEVDVVVRNLRGRLNLAEVKRVALSEVVEGMGVRRMRKAWG